MALFPYHSGVPTEWLAEGDEPDVEQAVLAPGLRERGLVHPEVGRLRYLTRTAVAARESPHTPAVGPSFWVHFWTARWRPNHWVVARCAEAGWTRDIPGLYRFGGWHFEFSKAAFPAGITMKFVVDGVHWMLGADRTLSPDENHNLHEDAVTFPPVESRLVIPYDNFPLRTDHDVHQVLVQNTNERVTYDAIVIGSGMGGGILADRLSDNDVKTLLLEAGGLAYSTHINNLPGDWAALPERHQVRNFENRDGSSFLRGVQMNLGGRSVFWSGLIPRMRAWEMEKWPPAVREYLAGEGYQEAERHLRKSQTLGPFQDRLVKSLTEAFPDFIVSDLPRSRHQPNLAADDTVSDVLETSTGVFSTADLLLDSLAFPGRAGRDNLTVNLNHLVTRVETQGRRAVAVVCQDLAGNVERRYVGERVFLCAGSLESARIALQSDLEPKGKIGRGLTDHPAYFTHGDSLGYVVPSRLPDGSVNPYGDPARHAKILMQHRDASEDHHSFNVEVLLNGWFWDLRHADDDVRREQLNPHSQARVKFSFIFQSYLNDDNWVQVQGPDKLLAVKVEPNPSGERFHDECKQLRNEFLRFFGVSEFDPNQPLGYGNQGTPHHAGGTLRMSDDHSGVVDADLKFERYDNLYACDVSVFPSIPCANPSLTLGALAIRLAEHVIARRRTTALR